MPQNALIRAEANFHKANLKSQGDKLKYPGAKLEASGAKEKAWEANLKSQIDSMSQDWIFR